MRSDAPARVITFHLRSSVLWRESRWHCECGYVSAHWTANLYVDDVIVTECATDTLTSMIRIAERWRRAVKSDATSAELWDILRAIAADHRGSDQERRAITRGGRRSTDPGH